MGQPVRRVLFRRTVAGPAATIIHLRTPLPTPSSGLPGHSGEQPSNVPCLALLQVGFTLPFQSPGKRWSLTPPFHPYPCKQRRSVFCGTGLRVAPSGRYPPPCSTEPGRSSGCSHNTRSSSCPIRPSSIAVHGTMNRRKNQPRTGLVLRKIPNRLRRDALADFSASAQIRSITCGSDKSGSLAGSGCNALALPTGMDVMFPPPSFSFYCRRAESAVSGRVVSANAMARILANIFTTWASSSVRSPTSAASKVSIP